MNKEISNFREFSISTYRKEKKLSQEKLAELIYMSRSSISNIEVNGCTDINIIAKLSEHLDFKVEIENGAIKIINKIKERMENDNMNTKTTNIKGILLSKYKEDYISTIKNFVSTNAYYTNIDKDSIKESSYDNVIEALSTEDCLEICIASKPMKINIECTLYESEDYYMIAFIGFDAIKDMHINSVFNIYTKDTLEDADIFVDDVFEFRDWVEVKNS